MTSFWWKRAVPLVVVGVLLSLILPASPPLASGAVAGAGVQPIAGRHAVLQESRTSNAVVAPDRFTVPAGAGRFVQVASTGPHGEPGVDCYDGVNRIGALTASGTYLTFSLPGNESLFLYSEFIGASGSVPTGLGAQTSTFSSFVGTDRSGWISGAPTFDRATYRDLWPGIDLVYGTSGGHLKYEYHVSAGADWSLISSRISGADTIAVSNDGKTLDVTSGGFTVLDDGLVAYDDLGAPVDVHFTVSGDTVGFSVGDTGGRAFVIDPVVYCTYLGGSGIDVAYDVALAGDGVAVVTGRTSSADFPTTPGVVNSTQTATGRVFVTGMADNGTALLFSTFIGGSAFGRGYGVAVNETGHIFVCGDTDSVDFPVTSGAYGQAHGSAGASLNGFISVLSPDATTLVYSSYINTTNTLVPRDLSVAPGLVHVVGVSAGGAAPVTVGAFDTTYNGGANDGWYGVFRPRGNGSDDLQYGTYVGTAWHQDALLSCTINRGTVYVAGNMGGTNSQIVHPNATQTTARSSDQEDGWWGIVDPVGSGTSDLQYGTYFGALLNDHISGISVRNGTVACGGNTEDPGVYGAGGSLYRSSGANRTARGSSFADGFVATWEPDPSISAYKFGFSSLVGGTFGADAVRDVSIGPGGQVAFVGAFRYDFSVGFTSDAFQSTTVGNQAAVCGVLSRDGAWMDYLTAIDSDQELADEAHAVVVDEHWQATVVGQLGNGSLPTTPLAYQNKSPSTLVADPSGFLWRWHFDTMAPDGVVKLAPQFVPLGTTFRVYFNVSDNPMYPSGGPGGSANVTLDGTVYPAVPSSGPWEWERDIVVNTQPNVTYNITVEDYWGNVNTTVNYVLNVTENVAPSIQILQALDNVTAGAAYLVKARVTDQHRVISVTIGVNGTHYAMTNTTESPDVFTWAGILDTVGTYLFSVGAIDQWGNARDVKFSAEALEYAGPDAEVVADEVVAPPPAVVREPTISDETDLFWYILAVVVAAVMLTFVLFAPDTVDYVLPSVALLGAVSWIIMAVVETAGVAGAFTVAEATLVWAAVGMWTYLTHRSVVSAKKKDGNKWLGFLAGLAGVFAVWAAFAFAFEGATSYFSWAAVSLAAGGGIGAANSVAFGGGMASLGPEPETNWGLVGVIASVALMALGVALVVMRLLFPLGF